MRFFLRLDERQYTRLQVLLEDNAERAAHMLPALAATTELYREEQRAIFDTHGESSGQAWEDLTPLSKITKQAKGFEEFMVKTGALKGSLTRGRGTKYSLTGVMGQVASYGTSSPVAHLQARGTKDRYNKNGRYTGKIPAREMAYVGPATLNRFFNILRNYLDSGVISSAYVSED